MDTVILSKYKLYSDLDNLDTSLWTEEYLLPSMKREWVSGLEGEWCYRNISIIQPCRHQKAAANENHVLSFSVRY